MRISDWSSDVCSSDLNAPEATLYGAEIEAQKYFPLADWSDSPFFTSRRIVLIGNYTYTQSELKVKEGDTTVPYTYGSGPLPAASDYFMDGAPLPGQSDHIINFQLGIADTDCMLQQTLILHLLRARVTRRGTNHEPKNTDH